MNQTSLKSKVREMDANELEILASQLVNKKNHSGLTGEEQEILWSIPAYYKQITGKEIVVETKLQLVS